MTLNFLTLENGLDYAIIDAITTDNNNYLVLVNENDENDLVIRKIITENGKEYFTKLDTDEEFNKVMIEIAKKHKKEEENE